MRAKPLPDCIYALPLQYRFKKEDIPIKTKERKPIY
jgi:hypothetical protein